MQQSNLRTQLAAPPFNATFPTHVKALLEGGELPFEREEIEGSVDGFALPTAAKVFVVQIQRVETKTSVAQLHLGIVAEHWTGGGGGGGGGGNGMMKRLSEE